MSEMNRTSNPNQRKSASSGYSSGGGQKRTSNSGRNASYASQSRKKSSPPPQNHSTSSGNPKKKKKHSKAFLIIKKFFTIILTTMMSLFLIMIITGTIVATAFTVYVLDFMEETTGVTFQELEQSSDTFFYAYDNRPSDEAQESDIDAQISGEQSYDGSAKLITLQQIKTGGNQRIPVSIDKVPQHVRDAFVYTEDENFYNHEGVDYKRTFSAFLNMFIHIYDTEQGGSTITQQLVKNLTGDDEHSPSRKIREIFQAMELEKRYSKNEILEQYLNVIGFGGPHNGIQIAAIKYFGKDVSELSTAEAACLAAIPKNPNYYYPLAYKTDDETGEVILDGKMNNRERQKYVLWQIYKNGAITYDEYQQYLNEKIIFRGTDEYKALHPEDEAEELEKENDTYSWPVELAIREVRDYLCETYNIDGAEAIRRINKGGYQIYLTVDMEMQDYVDQKFSDRSNLYSCKSRWVDKDGDGECDADQDYPQVGFIAMNYNGEVLALGGKIGEKTGKLVDSYVFNDPRQIGSTMKPISTYGLAFSEDEIQWGTPLLDDYVEIIDGEKWPTNYSVSSTFSVSHSNVKVYKAIEKSHNTIPARICKQMTPERVYEFATKKMGLELDERDKALSPLSVGALTKGITVENLVNAYMPYGNGGTYYKAHIVSKICQGNNQVVLENDGNPHEAVDSQTAWVMNRLLKNVIDHGTGTAAKMSNTELCAKTGTTNEWKELTFVGLTPDFVSGIIMGYKDHGAMDKLGLNSAAVWKKIMGDWISTHAIKTEFDPDPDVISGAVCSVTGKRASSTCPKEGITGYWKSSNCDVCTGGHSAPKPVEEGNGEGGDNNNNNAGGENAQPQQQQQAAPQPPADNGGGEAPAAE